MVWKFSPTINKELSSRMSILVKNIIALSIASALSLTAVNTSNAATYKIVDTGEVSKLKYTYAQHQNINGDMAISGTAIYNLPVQFQYLDDDDFNAIQTYANARYLSVLALENIEDFDALKAGTPTPNDLAWVIRWLQDPQSGKGFDIEYQKLGDTLAMTNLAGVTEDYNLWDETFEGTDTLTRSTKDIVSGITDSGISYGTGTAPYLPSSLFTDENGVERTFWLREYGIRGFFSYDQGAQVHQVVPFETQFGGGRSAILDVNESGIAVGFSSYKLAKTFTDFIDDETGGCADPSVVPGQMTLEACIGNVQLRTPTDTYHTMALKAILDENGSVEAEQLGLLVTPHPDDTRTFSSYALAVNANGVAVGFADGFFDETVTTPAEDERRIYRNASRQIQNYQFAVVYKNGNVIDLSGDHTDKGSSRAYDINESGVAVGHIEKIVSGKLVQKFFYVDTSVPTDEINMVTPDDFFSGSTSTARAINNNDLIVGEGQIETHNESTQNPRRTAAFVYNMNDDIFTNLNDTIPCSLRLNYDILEARGINDEGMISATAIVKADRRDATGEIMLDANGTPLKEDVVRAISLQPMPDDGEVCTAEEEKKVIRKGASVSFAGVLTIMALFGIRRKYFS